MLKEPQNYKQTLRKKSVRIWSYSGPYFPALGLNLHLIKSNQISAYRKLNLLLTSGIYFGFLPLAMQKRLKQTKVYHSFSYFVWKETTQKPLKVAAAKTLFSSVYFIGTTSFDESFLLCLITGGHYFLWKFIVTLRLWSALLLLSLKLVFWKKSRIFMCYLHNSNMMLIPNFCY